MFIRMSIKGVTARGREGGRACSAMEKTAANRAIGRRISGGGAAIVLTRRGRNRLIGAKGRRIGHGLLGLGRCRRGRCRRSRGMTGNPARYGSAIAVSGLSASSTSGPALCISRGIRMADRYSPRLEDAVRTNPSCLAFIAVALGAGNAEVGDCGRGPNGGTC